MFDSLLSATTVTTSSSWCITGGDSSFPINPDSLWDSASPRFFLPFLPSCFFSWFLCLAHKRALSPFNILSPFKLLFKIPLLCSHSVWEEGSRLNGSQRGPWTSRGETLDLTQALNHPQISQSIFLCSLRVSSHSSSPSPPSFFLSPFVDSPAVDPDEQGPALRRSCKEWM